MIYVKKKDPNSFSQSKKIAKQGGNVARNARKDIEKQLGEEVVTTKNAKSLLSKDKKTIE